MRRKRIAMTANVVPWLCRHAGGEHHPPHEANRLIYQAVSMVALAGMLLLSQSGCNMVGSRRLVEELTTENARLLSEYRAEKSRRLDAERRLEIARQRLAESEKLLARQYGHATSSEELTARGPNRQWNANNSASSSSADQDDIEWQRRIENP